MSSENLGRDVLRSMSSRRIRFYEERAQLRTERQELSNLLAAPLEDYLAAAHFEWVMTRGMILNDRTLHQEDKDAMVGMAEANFKAKVSELSDRYENAPLRLQAIRKRLTELEGLLQDNSRRSHFFLRAAAEVETIMETPTYQTGRGLERSATPGSRAKCPDCEGSGTVFGALAETICRRCSGRGHSPDY